MNVCMYVCMCRFINHLAGRLGTGYTCKLRGVRRKRACKAAPKANVQVIRRQGTLILHNPNLPPAAREMGLVVPREGGAETKKS